MAREHGGTGGAHPGRGRNPGPDSGPDLRQALFHDLPSVTNRSFHPIPIGDSFGYPGQGGYGEELRWGDAPGRGARGRSHRGLGPGGAWRSDGRIQDDLHARLTDHDGIDATAVLPVVSEGMVTLNGWVPERRMKHLAEELARTCPGVREVDNRIQVGGDAADFGPRGAAVRSGGARGSGFSSSERTEFSDRAIGSTGAEGVADVPRAPAADATPRKG